MKSNFNYWINPKWYGYESAVFIRPWDREPSSIEEISQPEWGFVLKVLNEAAPEMMRAAELKIPSLEKEFESYFKEHKSGKSKGGMIEFVPTHCLLLISLTGFLSYISSHLHIDNNPG